MKDIEVLIVNDGSTDRTAEIAAEYVSKYPDTFILINKENGGHGSTINTGIKEASGKYFKLVDADDWVERDGIIDLVKKVGCCSADAIISPYYKFFVTENKKRLQNVFHDKAHGGVCIEQEKDVKKVAGKCEFSLHALTFKTSLLKENFTEITEKCFFVDIEYDAFYSVHISTLLVSDIPVYVYRFGNDEQSVALKNMVRRRSQHLIVCKKLLEFYSNILGVVPDINLQIVKRLIENIVANQVRILLEIEDKYQSEEELKSFVMYLKTNNLSLYKDIIKSGIKERKETIILTFILEKTKFLFYGMLHRLIHSEKNKKF